MRSTNETTQQDSTSPDAILRKMIADAIAEAAADGTLAKAVAARSNPAYYVAPPAPAPEPAYRQAADPVRRSFNAAPVATVAGAVVLAVVLLSTVTALLMAVAITALALTISAIAIVILLKMLKKEMAK